MGGAVPLFHGDLCRCLYVKEFEAKEAFILEEREKKRKGLETELRKIRADIAEVSEKFDESLQTLRPGPCVLGPVSMCPGFVLACEDWAGVFPRRRVFLEVRKPAGFVH